MSREDPKPGRWILPLVVGAMLFFTYVFVNALPPADPDADGDITTTTIADGTTETTTTTTLLDAATTTTVSPVTSAFLEEIAGVGSTAIGLAVDARAINDQWDARTAGLSEIRAELDRINQEANAIATQIEAVTIPEGIEEEWASVLSAADALRTHAEGMVDGLASSDDGTIRRTALLDFEAAANELNGALDDADAAVRFG